LSNKVRKALEAVRSTVECNFQLLPKPEVINTSPSRKFGKPSGPVVGSGELGGLSMVSEDLFVGVMEDSLDPCQHCQHHNKAGLTY
jgi:hypothetical protein